MALFKGHPIHCVPVEKESFIIGSVLAVRKITTIICITYSIYQIYGHEPVIRTLEKVVSSAENREPDDIGKSVVAVLICLLFLYILQVVMSCLLLVGIHQKKWFWIRIHYTTYFMTLSAGLLPLITLMSMLMQPSMTQFCVARGIVIAEMVFYFFEIPCIVLVRDCYMKKKDSDSSATVIITT